MDAHQLVLNADADLAALVNARLVGDDHARLKHNGVPAVQGMGALMDIAESTYPSGPFKKAIDEAKAYWRAHKQ